MAPRWAIEPILLHTALVPGPEVLFQADFDRQIEIAIFAFLLTDGDGRAVLLDTGLPADYAALNVAVRARKGAWSGFRDAGARLAERLAGRSLDAIVLTSFGPYAVGGLAESAAPRVLVSARGLADLDAAEVAVFRHPLAPPVEAELRGRGTAVNGRINVFPGLAVYEVGIHHPASMMVVMETETGRVAIADPIFHGENLTRGLPLGVAEYPAHWVALVSDLAGRVDAILPIHDPAAPLVPVAAIDPRLRAPASLRQERVAW